MIAAINDFGVTIGDHGLTEPRLVMVVFVVLVVFRVEGRCVLESPSKVEGNTRVSADDCLIDGAAGSSKDFV